MVEASHVSVGYDRKWVLEDISFRLSAGEALCLLGQNGCGKSTLLKAMLGLLSYKGEISCEGRPVCSLAPKDMAGLFAYIPQHPQMDFAYTAREMVVMGRTAQLGLMAQPGREDYHAADEILDHLGCGHLSSRSVPSLSGGERKLVSIARAVCQQASFLLMDEPTAELDYANQLHIQQVIGELQKQGVGFVIATHASDLPFQLADRILLLGDGKSLGFGTPEEVLTPDRLEAAFGVPMETAEVTDRFGQKKRLCYAVNPPAQ